TNTLSNLFDAAVENETFPLHVPIEDVYLGEYGWPVLGKIGPDIGAPAPSLPSLGVDLRLTVKLSRDPITQEVIAAVTLHNRGMTPATNVEITDARLNLRNMRANHTPRHKRVSFDHAETFLLRFPGLTGATAVLRISGRYLGGTFGGSI